MKFVIIGADAAGMSAASRAKRTKPDMGVVVLEKTQDVSYSACGMPYNIADVDRGVDDLVVRAAEVFRKKQGIDLTTGARVESIDTKNRTVSGTRLENGAVFTSAYDRLLIATGGRPIVPNRPGFDLPGVLALKSLDDGRRIKNFIGRRGVNRAVIIGMGYIGLEMAEALRQRDIDVAMVKPGPDLLPWMPRELAQVVFDTLDANGVRLHLGQNTSAIEGADGKLEVVCDHGSLSTDLVLVAMGIVPNSELAVDAGIETGDGKSIAVDRNLKTSDESVYAAGDCADSFHVVTGKKTWIPLALRANRAGWAVADNVCGIPTRLEGVAGTAVFKVFDLQVARTGLTVEQANAHGFDTASVIIQSRSRAHAHPGSETIWVHLVGGKGQRPAFGSPNGRPGRRGPSHKCRGRGPARQDDGIGIFPDRSGLCAPIWPCMGPVAYGGESVDEKAIDF